MIKQSYLCSPTKTVGQEPPRGTHKRPIAKKNRLKGVQGWTFHDESAYARMLIQYSVRGFPVDGTFCQLVASRLRKTTAEVYAFHCRQVSRHKTAKQVVVSILSRKKGGGSDVALPSCQEDQSLPNTQKCTPQPWISQADHADINDYENLPFAESCPNSQDYDCEDSWPLDGFDGEGLSIEKDAWKESESNYGDCNCEVYCYDMHYFYASEKGQASEQFPYRGGWSFIYQTR